MVQANRKTMGTIECGDVLETLNSLPDEWIFDVVIADPPYNVGVDFGDYKDSEPIDEYIEWTRQWVDACRKRLKMGGVMYIYGFAEILARIAVQYPVNAQRWLQWHYTNKTAPSSKFWQRSHESILCLWREGECRPMLEIDQIREPYTKSYLRIGGTIRRGTPSRFGKSGRATIYNTHSNGALPRDVIKVPALAGGAGRAERWFLCKDHANSVFPPAQIDEHRDCDVLKHPTQKPAELTKRLLMSKINGTGGSVLIPFAGSGSECVVAQALGYEFFGIELNPLYVRLGTQWIEQTKPAQRVMDV